MIQVQIASSLEAQGLAGVRWVLVDPSESPAAAGAAPQGALPPAGPPAPQPPVPGLRIRRTSLALKVACAVVLLSALAAAWWVAGRMLDSRGASGATTVVKSGRPAG